jgi:beta-galactosidase
LAKVLVKVHVLNEDATALRQEMRADLVDRQGKIVASVEVPTMTIDAGIEQEHVLTLNVAAPHLWSPDSPYLYTLRATLLAAGTTIETEELKIGIRSIRCSTDGFFLNGEKVVLNGVNRHQDYPYIGYALSPEAQYRDAFKIKEAGFNFVRLSHYPQDPGFLSAMDELGLMAMAPVLGWQYSQNTLEFNEQKYQEFRELIRRDRNHPCVVLWEPGLKSPV